MTRYLRQGELHFTPGYKLQTQWGPIEAGVFTLECAGAGLIAASLIGEEHAAALAFGLAMIAAAVGLLLAHLGHPRRAWRAILNVRTSWISRGTLVLGGVLGCGVLHLLLGGGGVTALLRWVLLAGCGFILVYPGLALSASPAIPFWTSGLLPVVSALSGAASGLALYILWAGGPPNVLSWVLAALALALMLYLVVMARQGGAAAESAALLLRGEAMLFLGLGCGLGIVLPALLGLAGGGAAVASAAIARLAGDFATRHAFLKVGMFSPVA